jgi:hypothetical protein
MGALIAYEKFNTLVTNNIMQFDGRLSSRNEYTENQNKKAAAQKKYSTNSLVYLFGTASKLRLYCRNDETILLIHFTCQLYFGLGEYLFHKNCLVVKWLCWQVNQVAFYCLRILFQ